MKNTKFIFLISIFIFSLKSNASIVTSSTFETFENTVSSELLNETFNSYSTDIQLTNSPLDFDNFTISLVGTEDSLIANLIDASLFVHGPFDIDNSTYLFLKTRPNTSVVIDFNNPITHFGATFRGLQNGSERMEFIIEDEVITPTIDSQNDTIRFLGLSSSTPFDKITLQSKNELIDGFGMDNIYSNPTLIPLPASIAFFLSSLLFFTRLKK
jgi:hypothetical protein